MKNTSEEEVYSRQIRLPEIGRAGQDKLAAAQVLIIGAGGLGHPAALYLAGAGVGQITIVDGDRVEASNLPRQVIFAPSDIGKNKAQAATQKLSSQFPGTRFEAIDQYLKTTNGKEIFKDAHVVLDASDNFKTRYLVNALSVELSIPLVSASVAGWEGQFAVFNYQGSPCYSCLFPEPPIDAASCDEIGVMGSLCGILGNMQALEAAKIIIGSMPIFASKFMSINGATMEFTGFGFSRRKGCSCDPNLKKSISVPANDSQQLQFLVDAIDGSSITASFLHKNRAVFTVFDIRPDYQRRGGGIENAHSTPADLVEKSIQGKDQLAVIYCQTGNQSMEVVNRLRSKGYSKVYNLDGGWVGYRIDVLP